MEVHLPSNKIQVVNSNWLKKKFQTVLCGSMELQFLVNS
jgi:hypothetical protein